MESNITSTKKESLWKKIILGIFVAWMWILNLLYYADSIGMNFTKISDTLKMMLKTFFWS